MPSPSPLNTQTDPADLPIPEDVPSLIIPLLSRLEIDRLGLLAEIDLASIRAGRSVGTKKWLDLRDVVVQARARVGVTGPLERSLADWDGRTGPWSGSVRPPSVLVEPLLRAGITTIEALGIALDAGRIPGDSDDLLSTVSAAALQRLGEDVRQARSTVVVPPEPVPKKELPQPRSFADFFAAMRDEVPQADWSAVLLRACGGSLRQAGTMLGVTGERARQRTGRALKRVDPVLRLAASELLEPLEARLTDRVESLDEVLVDFGLDSVAAFGLARLLLDRDVPQVRFGVVTLNPMTLTKLSGRLIAQIKEAGSVGLAPTELGTSGISLSEEALEQLVGPQVTVLANGRLRFVETAPALA